MRAVIQRVNRASVRVAGAPVASIGRGFLVLVGVENEDGETDAAYVAQKISELRIFEDSAGKMNLGLAEVGGEVLAVSQFTLLGDCRRGRRPSFTKAARPEEAEALFARMVALLEAKGNRVSTGRFRANMEVDLINDGPVTMLVDSRRLF
ncbi:MAG: D-tyrosyl-tRNA(Tyr) deacylase [Deltaproteobacteria bacterium]|nr:D-tyrosyl-tRNA(Tyr) deacylase [Deltaproteobacteria bacterium]